MTRAEDCMNRIISWMKKHEAGEISEHAFANRALAIANQYDAWEKLGGIELDNTDAEAVAKRITEVL